MSLGPIQFVGHSSSCTTAVVHLLAYASLWRLLLVCLCVCHRRRQKRGQFVRKAICDGGVLVGGGQSSSSSSSCSPVLAGGRRLRVLTVIDLRRWRMNHVADVPDQRERGSRPPLSLSWGNGQLGIRTKCVEIDRGIDALTCCYDLYLRPANLSP